MTEPFNAMQLLFSPPFAVSEAMSRNAGVLRENQAKSLDAMQRFANGSLQYAAEARELRRRRSGAGGSFRRAACFYFLNITYRQPQRHKNLRIFSRFEKK